MLSLFFRNREPRFALVVSLLLVFAVLTLAPLVFLRSSDAAEPDPRATLRGLSGVEVIIEDLGKEVEHTELSKKQLQTDVEHKLRHAGIPVLTRKEAFEQPGAPGLYVRLGTVPVPALGVYLLSIEVAVVQGVALTRDPAITTVVPTWRTASIGVVGTTKVEQIQDAIGQYVDHFIHAYLAMNPETTNRTHNSRRRRSAVPGLVTPRAPGMGRGAEIH